VSALEDAPEVEDFSADSIPDFPAEEIVADEIIDGKPNLPSTAFTSETAAAATAEREAQKAVRQKSMGARIREMVGHDPARLANLLFDIAENISGKERSADRIKATTELMDRGWGKAPTFMPIENADPLNQSDLDQAIRDIADQLVARRAHPTLDAEMIRREIAEGVRPDPEEMR
jgi:hypothetical protein